LTSVSCVVVITARITPTVSRLTILRQIFTVTLFVTVVTKPTSDTLYKAIKIELTYNSKLPI